MKPYILVVRPRLDPSGKTVKKLLIEPQEIRKLGVDGEVEEAHLCIRYRVIEAAVSGEREQTYEFPACYDRSCGEGGRICLTGSSLFEGAVFLEPDSLKGNRIGSFIMNEIVQWATSWPDAEINQVKLFAHQGHGNDKLRRNRFYEQFGIRFDYTDNTHAEGIARPMQARSLTPWPQLPDNLSVMRLEEFLDEQEECLFKTQLDAGSQQRLIESFQSEITHAFDHPVWFATKTILAKHPNSILGAIIIGALVWSLW